MANWKHKVTINGWNQTQSDPDTYPIVKLIDTIVVAFQTQLPIPLVHEIQLQLSDLRDLQEEAYETDGEDVDADEFDITWHEIYDWADQRKVWVDLK